MLKVKHLAARCKMTTLPRPFLWSLIGFALGFALASFFIGPRPGYSTNLVVMAQSGAQLGAIGYLLALIYGFYRRNP